MSTLTVEIQARVNDTLKKLGATQAQIDAINDALQETTPAAKQAGAAMDNIAGKTAKAGAAARGSSQKFFQLGQAISDFSVAGIRGAANNLEFLALQVGVSGPLLLALSAATSALVVFGDKILAALDPVGEKVKELREGLEDVLKVVETGGTSLFLFEDQIPGALAEAEAAVVSINAEIQDLIGANQGTPELAYLNRDKIRAAQGELAKAEALIDRIQAKRDEYARRDAAADASRTLSAVAANAELAKALRADFERVGLAEQLAKITDEQLVTATREGKLRELLLALQEKRAKAQREEVTEIERAQKKVEELAGELERRRSGELSVLDTLRDQASALQQQVALVNRLNEARRQQAERGAPQRAAVAGAQTPDTSLAATLDALRQAREREQKDRQRSEIGSEFLRQLPEGVAEDAAAQAIEQQRALQDEFSASIALADALNAEISQGLSDSLITLADAFGVAAASGDGFKGFGNTLLVSLADLAGNVGRIAIGTGVAVAGIKKALQTLNPIVAIGAGAALVALSAAVKGKLADAAGGGASGASYGGLYGRGGSGAYEVANVPRQGPPGQPLSPSYVPLPPSLPSVVQVEGTFDLEGENLRAAVRNTDRRVQATRSTSN